MDYWSKYRVTFPLMNKAAAEIVLCLQNAFSYLGTPKTLHSNNGREFVNEVVYNLSLQTGQEKLLALMGGPLSSQWKISQSNVTMGVIANRNLAPRLLQR